MAARSLRCLLLLALLAWVSAPDRLEAAPGAWDRPIARGAARHSLRALLREVRGAAQRGERPIVIFDIDDTVLNGRPRLRAAAAAVGLPSEGLASQRDLYAGLHGAELATKREAFGALYFNDPALARLDRAQRGAPRLLGALARAGARNLYVSGRWESTRAATERLLAEHRLPLAHPRDLLLNPSENVKASDYKRAIPRRLAAEGRPMAVFDNEAEAVLAYHEAFPAARAYRLATFRFRDAPEEKPAGVEVLRNFVMGR